MAAVNQHQRSRVPCVSFDSFAREVHLRDAVIKADIEGGEARLLQGMASSRERVLDFMCEVLEDAFQRGLVSEAASLLNPDAYLIGDGTVFPSATVSRGIAPTVTGCSPEDLARFWNVWSARAESALRQRLA